MYPSVLMDSTHINSFAYVDDISVCNGTAPGLQSLIDKYASDTWRFKFEVNETKCMIMGQNAVDSHPSCRTWSRDGCPIETTNNLYVLDMKVSSNPSCSAYTEERMTKCDNNRTHHLH